MTNAAQHTTRTTSWALMVVAVGLVAINLRMTITGVGPLLDEIAADRGVTPATLGFLASLPLLAWAMVSPLAHGFAARVGLNAAISWSLLALIAATVWRSLPGSSLNLWFGTALLGATLAIGNVLLPAVIKRDFSSRVPQMMGMYSALLGISAGIGAAMVAPISHVPTSTGETLGWRWALAATAVFAPLALAVWLVAAARAKVRQRKIDQALPKSNSSDPVVPTGLGRLSVQVWRDPVAWTIAFYMGMLSSNFFVFGTWLSPIDISRGTDTVIAGFNVSVFHLFSVVGSIIAPFFIRGTLRRVMPILSPATIALGGVGVVFVPGGLHLWYALAGLACGAGLVTALSFIAERSGNVRTASAVSGMVQSFGYLIGALGPVLFGWFFELSGGWVLPLSVITGAAALQLLAGLVLWSDRMALPQFSTQSEARAPV